jgi:release factor glutamine methyltransferase
VAKVRRSWGNASLRKTFRHFPLAVPLPSPRIVRPLKTVLEVITSTASYFAKHGVESARLNIELLLAHVLQKKRMDLYLEFERTLSEAELAPLRDLVKRRAAGEPLQHLLGTVEFFKHTLRCDGRALVPRPETEQLCELLFMEAKSETCAWKAGRIVDVGTGTGCIALALAAQFPDAEVHAVDLSPDALALARENAATLGLTDRVTFHQADLLTGLDGPFDLIVSNPPYIPTADLATLPREVRHDPTAALDGGPDGLAIVRRLLAQAAPLLRSGARLALELGENQPTRLAPELTENFTAIQPFPDYSHRDRYLFATRKNESESATAVPPTPPEK